MASLVDHASAHCKQQDMGGLSDKWGKEGSTPRFNQALAKGRGEPCPFCHRVTKALYAVVSKPSAIPAIPVSYMLWRRIDHLCTKGISSFLQFQEDPSSFLLLCAQAREPFPFHAVRLSETGQRLAHLRIVSGLAGVSGGAQWENVCFVVQKFLSF